MSEPRKRRISIALVAAVADYQRAMANSEPLDYHAAVDSDRPNGIRFPLPEPLPDGVIWMKLEPGDCVYRCGSCVRDDHLTGESDCAPA